MDATTWAVIGLGFTVLGATITILVAIGKAFGNLRKAIDAQGEKLQERIDAQGEKIVYLRERMAKVEGLLEGLREAITGKRAA